MIFLSAMVQFNDRKEMLTQISGRIIFDDNFIVNIEYIRFVS